MKIRFIINPKAGKGKQKNIESLIKKNFNWKKYDIVYTKKSGGASILCEEAIKENINIIIAVGGDGTVNECAKIIINKDIALGVIPCGSGNGFAYHIGMPKNIIRSIKKLNKCQIQTIDSATVNSIPFVNVAGIGFDAHIAYLFSKIKTRGFISYIKLVMQELSYKAKEYTITHKSNKIKVYAFFIAFANSSQYGNDIKISPYSKNNDGKTDIIIIQKFPKWKIPLFLLQLYKGNIQENKYVQIISTKSIKIKHNDQHIHLDGEPTKVSNELEIKTHHKSLKIFC